MDTTLLCTFCLLLGLTGLGAPTAPSTADKSKVTNGITGTPVALCSPHDPNHCGLD